MVLIVDDKAENIFSLRRTLELSGFDVDEAGSGEEALRKILKSSYSLIILDVQMPGMDGFEVAEAISGYSKARDIPIIFLSAVNTDKKFIARGYSSGAVDYVTKPVDPDLFILRVKTLLKLYEQNKALNETRISLLEEVFVRKRAEEELNRSIQELRSVMEAMPQIAFTLTTEGNIEYANEPWFAYASDLDQMPEFHPEDSGVEAAIKEALQHDQPLVSSVRIRNIQSGLFRYHLLRMIPVRRSEKIIKWVGTFTDIHEQMAAHEVLEQMVKERTEELLLKNEELETSNHELQQFASVASHDLKEPLRKIQVFSSILSQRFLAGNPEGQEMIKRIIDSSFRMSTLISDLLDFSRLSVDAAFMKTDIRELIEDILTDLEFAIKEKQATVRLVNLPVIDAIPGQMRQVFQNLISNSLKFVAKGTAPVIEVSGELLDSTLEPMCRIMVQDNGIGFDEQYLDKIFTIFQRLNTRESYEGTGIGLAIVKKIIEKHRGTITARSEEGKGATFIIDLPLHQHAPENALEIPETRQVYDA